MKRYALIKNGEEKQIAAYLPGNYYVMATVEEGVVIAGEDNCGWTMDDYVLPRLASGLYWGEEIDLSHPVMKKVPLKWGPNVESNVTF